MNEWISLLLGIVIGGGLFALGIKYFPQLARQKQNYPFEDEIESALLPYIFNAIASAYKVSEQAVDEVQTRLRGADKARIAGAVYEMLPDQIAGRDISAIKDSLGEERFAELVENSYQRFDQFFDQHRQRFDQLYEAWKQENAPG